MLHTASLLHDDVLDDAELRRGAPSANALFGNKAAILGGDYLLSRASVELARLKDVEVVELMATVLEHLVKGEVLQSHLQSAKSSLLDLYLCKTFYKTASLLSNSCQSAVVLTGHGKEIQDIVFEYGRHLGILFQVMVSSHIPKC
jgi:geranyl diphosphate synthase